MPAMTRNLVESRALRTMHVPIPEWATDDDPEPYAVVRELTKSEQSQWERLRKKEKAGTLTESEVQLHLIAWGG